MLRASRTSAILTPRRVFVAYRRTIGFGARYPVVLPVPVEEEAATSTLVEDIIFFAACYTAGVVFFLIMLS